MPTATTVTGAFTFEFHNIGALTSAWTRPTDVCSTVPVAPSGLSLPFNSLVLRQEVDNCGELESRLRPECTPGGEKLQELYDAPEATTAVIVGYHSPGLQCPDAWETVGVIAMNNGTPSATGLFSPTVFTYIPEETATEPYGNFVANILTSVLAPTETAIACCPTGYSADPWGGCYSNFPLVELASKTACERRYVGDDQLTAAPESFSYTWDFFGTTATAVGYRILPRPTDWNDPDSYTTTTLVLGPSGIPPQYANSSNIKDALTGVAVVDPIYLVNSGESAGGEGAGGEGAGGDGGEPPESAARALAPATAWTAVAGVLAVWGVGMVAGVGLLAAW